MNNANYYELPCQAAALTGSLVEKKQRKKFLRLILYIRNMEIEHDQLAFLAASLKAHLAASFLRRMSDFSGIKT